MAALTLLLLSACGDPAGPGGDNSATLSGVVRTVASMPLANATVSAGSRQATTDGNGRFEIIDMPLGEVTVRCKRPGYLTVDVTITIRAGANTHDCTLEEQEIYESGTTAAFIPAGLQSVRGAIIVLGGPVASGFVTGATLAPERPDVEASQQALGGSLRALARTAQVALLGTSVSNMANSAISDGALFAALATMAQLSGHAELANAPVLLFGISGGGPEAAGLAARNPGRTIGLAARVPSGLTSLTEAAALQVPAFVMLAALDEVIDNTARQMTFADNRGRGGLWALVVEPGRDHYGSTSENNAAVIEWMAAVLALRLPPSASDPLVSLDESAGWLGNQSTFEIASWSDYAGTRTSASWLLNASVAASWRDLATVPVGGR